MLVVVFDLLPLVALYGEPKAWPMVEAVSDRRLLGRAERAFGQTPSIEVVAQLSPEHTVPILGNSIISHVGWWLVGMVLALTIIGQCKCLRLVLGSSTSLRMAFNGRC